MASRTRLSLRLCCHGFKGRALKFYSRGGEPGDEAKALSLRAQFLRMTFDPELSGAGERGPRGGSTGSKGQLIGITCAIKAV